jgi:sugar transferase (PEP-CTERM system associated)
LIRFFNTYIPIRTFVLGVSEACLIVLSFVAAAIFRLGTNDASVTLQYEHGFLKIAVLAGSFILCMHYFDLYDSYVLSNRREVLTRLFQVLGSMCILLAFVYYFYPSLELGRGIVLIGLPIVLILLLLWRGVFTAFNRGLRFAERTLIFGDELAATQLLREVEIRPELGLNVVGRISVVGCGNYELLWDPVSPSRRYAGTIKEEELTAAVSAERVRRIIVALEDRRGRLPVELLLLMKSRGVLVEDGIELYEKITGKIPVESLRLGTLLFSPGFHLSRFVVFYKRFVSIVVSAVGLILTLPLLPLIALAIKLSSRGPIFYHQKRVGRNDVTYYCHKFRTMRADAEADTGPTWADDDDPRITPFGRFLRTTRLDEIPQLWNVLRGDMSLVGPRPERPEFIEKLKLEIPYYNLRHTVRPGITGWAQIRYKYGSSVEEAREKLRYDLYYIKRMSFGLDAWILFDTIKIILLGRGAR